MKEGTIKSKPLHPVVEKLIRELRYQAETPETADTLEHFMREAHGGNSELADIIRRMLKAEIAYIKQTKSGDATRLQQLEDHMPIS